MYGKIALTQELFSASKLAKQTKACAMLPNQLLWSQVLSKVFRSRSLLTEFDYKFPRLRD
jgi:hypothetical protein